MLVEIGSITVSDIIFKEILCKPLGKFYPFFQSTVLDVVMGVSLIKDLPWYLTRSFALFFTESWAVKALSCNIFLK